MIYIRIIAVLLVLVGSYSWGYKAGVESEQNKCLENKIQEITTATKENKDALKEAIEISNETSNKLKQETEVSHERKTVIAKTKADSDVLRVALPSDVVRLLHDATTANH